MYKSQKLLFILTSILFLGLAIFISYNAIQGRKVLRSKATEAACSTIRQRPACIERTDCRWNQDLRICENGSTLPPVGGDCSDSNHDQPGDCNADPNCNWVGDRNGSCQPVTQLPTVTPGTGGTGTTNLTQNSVAYIGCSNLMGAVEGYHDISNKHLLWPLYSIQGLTVDQWSHPGAAWDKFDQMKNSLKGQYGDPKAVFVSMCVLEREWKQGQTTDQTVVNMINMVKAKAPGVPIYLSPINSFNPKDLCGKIGVGGYDKILGFRNKAVADGLALPGPEGEAFGRLEVSEIGSPDHPNDTCHPNEAGKVKLGNDLVAFFDSLAVGSITPPAVTITTQPSPTGGPQPTQPPPGGTVNLTANLKLSFQGITTTRSQNMSVKVTLVGGTNRYEKSAEFTVDASGVWNGNVNFGAVQKRDDYYLLVKGPKHVQKRVCELTPTETRPGTYSCFQGAISVQTGALTANLSGIKLLVGDLPDQDGVIDSYDVSLVRNIIARPLAERQAAENVRLADLNLDGVVDSQDYSLVIAALSTRSDEN